MQRRCLPWSPLCPSAPGTEQALSVGLWSECRNTRPCSAGPGQTPRRIQQAPCPQAPSGGNRCGSQSSEHGPSRWKTRAGNTVAAGERPLCPADALIPARVSGGISAEGGSGQLHAACRRGRENLVSAASQAWMQCLVVLHAESSTNSIRVPVHLPRDAFGHHRFSL